MLIKANIEYKRKKEQKCKDKIYLVTEMGWWAELTITYGL
jgi:hypothetical protein